MVVDDVVGCSDVVDGEVDEVVGRIDVVDEEVDEVVRRVVVVLDTGGVGVGKIVGVGRLASGKVLGSEPLLEKASVFVPSRGQPCRMDRVCSTVCSGILQRTATEYFFIIGLTSTLCLSNHVNIPYYRLQSPGSQQLLFPPVLTFP